MDERRSQSPLRECSKLGSINKLAADRQSNPDLLNDQISLNKSLKADSIDKGSNKNFKTIP